MPTGPQQFDQSQKPVSPKGSIIVRAVDVGTAGPLDGVTVKVLGSDTVGTTNADGVFKFDNMVVNSSYMFIFEKAGYLRARQSASIQGSAGNSPLENSVTTFSIDLYPANGSVTGFVFLPNGTPAPNATVYVDQRNNLGSSAAESIVSATTGMDGSFTLMGLATRPTGQGTQVVARWYDENGDMQADYGSTSTTVTLFPGQPGRVFLTYSANSIGQRIIASNVFDGQVAAGEDLQFTFALPLFTGTLVGTTAAPWVLTQLSNSNANIPVEGTYMSPTELRVRPALNSLREGEEYRLTLSLRNASTNQGTGSQFTANIEFQVRPAMVVPFTTQVTGLTVTNPVSVAPFSQTSFDHNSTQFTVAFVPAAGALRYEVYARDTRTNPNYVLVQQFAATGAPRIERSVFLPTTFNAPFTSQPLAGGNRVNFAVVGIDAYGQRAPLMAATAVEVRDTVPPTALGVANAATGTPLVDAINDTSAPATIRLRITYSEPMDPTSMVTYTTSATPAPMTAWSWETTTSGILTLTIGANNDASGSFAIRGGRDAAGNDIVRAGDLVGSLTGRRELLANGDFQMGAMCGLGSWTPSTLNNGPAPSAVNNNGAIVGSTSACAAVLGSIPGGTAGVGRSRIVQDVTLASLMGTGHRYEFTGRHRSVNVPNAAAPGASYSFGCRVTTPADVLLQPLFTGNANFPGYLSAGPVDLSAQAGNSIRIQCETDNVNMMAPGFGAMYLDELSVALVKPGTL
jgi:hypothetical protein